MNLKIIFRTLLLFAVGTGYAQETTQTIRGTLTDQDAKAPLIGATVRVLDSTQAKGAITDLNGTFRIENVPVGRVSLLITFIGYEDKVIPNILVTAAKEVILNISMQESVENLEEVIVTAQKNKSEVLNEMATVSARTFSVEETQRYAGALSDPARMVASFAGVTGNAEGNNDIVVRGNSPKGILWRLEGVEIPNPNHFANEGATGGPINALNSNMLDNSDFFSGAFAPEYGNALSGVFDMRFKKGNNVRREYAAGASVFGIDFTAEGPFHEGYSGSYIANYRYSSLQLISELGFLDFGGIPKYQDASFNVELPLGEKNYLSVFGLGGLSSISVDEEDDEGNPLYRGMFDADLGIVGVNHMLFINNNSFLKNSFTAAGTASISDDNLPTESGGFYNVHNTHIKKGTYRLASTYNLKVSARHKLETGIIYSKLTYDAQANAYNFERAQMENTLDDKGESYTLQAFTSWKYRFNKDWTMTSGLHFLQFGLNNSYSVEPRLGIKWDAAKRHSFSAGFGLHSRLESIAIYLAKQVQENGESLTLNRSLKPTKAAHFVLGYDHMINPNTHLKLETYYQHLYDVPVEDDPQSYFSLINSSESYINYALVNQGTGRNYGLELTLERYFHQGFYYMSTLSLYQSLYTASDGVERGSAFNGNYVANLLAGKEFKIGKPEKQRILFVNSKIGLLGGSRYTAIDLEASRELGDVVHDEENPYGKRGDDIFFLNLAIGTRRNKKNTTREFKIDITNLTNHQGIVNEYYIHATGEIQQSPQLPFLPNIVYTFKF